MNAQLTDLRAWKASNDVRRLDEQHRMFGALPWNDGAGVDQPLNQTTDVHGAHQITDEWSQLEVDGFYQRDDGSMRLMPVVVYPGIVLAPWVEAFVTPPKDAALWLVIEHVLGSATWPASEASNPSTTGWNGQITATRAWLEWGTRDIRENQIFPDLYTNSMPKNSTFIWRQRIGFTDAAGRFSPFEKYHNLVAGQYCPPY